ncbi:hypothetical protein L1049_016716 [Liquidambar formosana]|uniref:F-box domain-containing protein n=1 Tax=Liquidambar formosana TaxID=63359 RepID=A0AAP0X394_LIQFO
MAETDKEELQKNSIKEIRNTSSCDDQGEDINLRIEVMETTGKKRKREREKDSEEEVLLQDPLEVFGSDIMMKILNHLDARSVALSLLVSRGWHGVACSDRLWTTKCEELWLGKAHIPRSSQVRGLSKLAAYSFSVMDGKRTRIMKEDLCDHVWEFHFRKGAPEYWRNLDPYWKGTGPPMHRYFHLDGSQTADPGDVVWGGHECCYSIVTSFVGGKIREHYVRINRWPQMSVSRKQDWSWEMSNHLYYYASIPDADKEDCSSNDGQRSGLSASVSVGISRLILSLCACVFPFFGAGGILIFLLLFLPTTSLVVKFCDGRGLVGLMIMLSLNVHFL